MKLDSHEYQTKVHLLMSKNYQEGIEKLRVALEELKREVGEVEQRRAKKR